VAVGEPVLADDGYEDISAQNGREAVRLLGERSGRLHLLLTDMIMPGMDGLELAKRVRAERPHVRVIWMSGYGRTTAGDAMAAVEFLQTPFTPEALLQNMRAVFDGGGESAEGGVGQG